MNSNDSLREHLLKILDWQDAHVGFDKAIEGIPPDMRGKQPHGLPYSAWQLLEHLRLSQFDILDFCRNQGYKEQQWPDDYWPKTSAPESAEAWTKSVQMFRSDNDAFKQLISDPKIDLFARIPHGTGQTYLREVLLAADHNAYHIGQLVTVRRLLGIWK